MVIHEQERLTPAARHEPQKLDPVRSQLPIENTTTDSEKSEKIQSGPYAELKSTISEISKRFGTRETTVIRSLIENTCEYRTRHEMESPNYFSEQEFDKYFTIKHDFIKSRFVQNLAIAFRKKGIQACIATEEKAIPGVYDVLVYNRKDVITISDEKIGRRICVELKGGQSFGLTQIERYLWENEVVILVRVLMNQVVRVSRTDIDPYLNQSLIRLRDRALIIAGDGVDGSNGGPQKIPGLYCKGCPVGKGCEFYKEATTSRLVSFNSESMQDDLLSIFRNLDGCVDKAIDTVMKELTG